MAGITECELHEGHPGLHQGRLWGDATFELQMWQVGGSWGCLPPFFTPNPDESEARPLTWPARLENGQIVRLDQPIPTDVYRCRRISCWQLQPAGATATCPKCSAPLCARCFRCGGLWPHGPSGELVYVSDRLPAPVARARVQNDIGSDSGSASRDS
jgi:hypothetical protein